MNLPKDQNMIKKEIFHNSTYAYALNVDDDSSKAKPDDMDLAKKNMQKH